MPVNNKDFNVNIGISKKDITIPDNQEYVDIDGFASRMSINGEKVIDLDQEHVDTTGFELIAKRILMNHNMQEPVGDLELTHDPEGVRIKARVYRKAMEEKEFERLKLGLYDFSIGFFATDGEYRLIGGKDVFCFTRGSIYETSLVAIPSNTMATIDNIKSKMVNGENPTKRELETLLREKCGFSKRQANKIANDYNPVVEEDAEVIKMLESTLANMDKSL